MKKNFVVKIYYSGFSTHLVKAENEDDAILKARNEKPKLKEICSNLENWKEADIAENM